MLMITSAAQGEQALTTGTLDCPGCAASLRPWGWTERRVRNAGDGQISLVRVRRARCRPCGISHVLLPACWLPRRLDEVDLIGSALLGAASGEGHRTLASRLNRPAGTVRGWLRRGRERAGWLHAELANAAEQVPDHRLGLTVPPATPLGPAIEAAGLVSAAYRRYLGPDLLPPWQLVSRLTDGRLLAGATAPT